MTAAAMPERVAGQNDAAHHFPARRAECERALFELTRNAEEELPADRRHDRNDHDRENHGGREEPLPGLLRVAEEGNEAQAAMQPGLDVVREKRPQHQDSPEPEHDARYGSEQLDERADDAAHASRRQLAEIEADRDRKRRREHERDERAHGGPVDEGQRAEDVLHRVPGAGRDEPQTETVEGVAREPEDLPDDRADECQARNGGGRGQAVQREITETAAEPAAGLERTRRAGAHRGRAY